MGLQKFTITIYLIFFAFESQGINAMLRLLVPMTRYLRYMGLGQHE